MTLYRGRGEVASGLMGLDSESYLARPVKAPNEGQVALARH